MKIKKVLVYICLLILFASFVACGTSPKSKKKYSEKNFDIKTATNITEMYMNYLVKEDYNNASKLYSKDITSNMKNNIVQALKVRGYNIEEINEVGKAGLFKVKVARASLIKPFATLEEYMLKVMKEGNDYKIVDINISTDDECFVVNGRLRIKNKNNADTNLLIEPSGIPNYIYPKSDKSKLNKEVIPKKNYGPMIFSYGGYRVAISTYDKNAFAGIVKIDESLTVQGNEDDNNDSGGQQQGAQGSSGGSKLVKEKPVGKEIIPLDLLKNSIVNYMVFSKNEKLIAIQYEMNKKNKCIKVYNSDSGDPIPYEFDKKYPIDKVNILFSSFGDDVLNYEVLPINKNDKSVEKYLGNWQINLKDFKEKKL